MQIKMCVCVCAYIYGHSCLICAWTQHTNTPVSGHFPLRCVCIWVHSGTQSGDLAQEAQSISVTNQRWGMGKSLWTRGGARWLIHPWVYFLMGLLYEWPVDCWFNGVWRACKMIDAVLLLSQEPVVLAVMWFTPWGTAQRNTPCRQLSQPPY